MTPEQVTTLLQAASEWGAEEQSSVNTVLLSIVVFLLGLLAVIARTFAKRILDKFEKFIEKVEEIETDVAVNKESIENIKAALGRRR